MVKDLDDPTNVDSVPAMLTPGEFVLNKEASMMFAPVIEQMNEAGLQQRKQGNAVLKANVGAKVGYNQGGLVGFLKEKEGYEDKAYQDDAGVWTIGYGRTTNPDGSKVQKGQTTKREAEDSWLDKRAADERTAIDAYAEKYGYDWNDGQKDALASFRYNGGQGMLDMLTDGGTRDNDTIQQKFGLYNKVTDPNTGKKVFVQGLQNRRDAELELWGGKPPSETKEAQPSGASQQTTQALQAPPPPTAAPPQPQVADPMMQGSNTVFAEGGEGSAPAGFFGAGLDALAGGLAGGNALPLVPPPGLQGVNPEYIPSVTAKNKKPQGLNEGGWFKKALGGSNPWEGKDWADVDVSDGEIKNQGWGTDSEHETRAQAINAAKEQKWIDNNNRQAIKDGKWKGYTEPEFLTSHFGKDNSGRSESIGNMSDEQFQQYRKAVEYRSDKQSYPESFNGGGQVQELNIGGWLKKLFNQAQQAPDQNAGYANYTPQQFQQEAQNLNNPGAQTQGYAVPEMMQPAMPGQPQMPTQQGPDGNPIPWNAPAGALQGQMSLANSPVSPPPPELDRTPPVPGSDEALLQGSSEQVESEEERKRKNEWLRNEARRFPQGDPRRAALMNQVSHQKGVVPEVESMVSGGGRSSAPAGSLPGAPPPVASGRGGAPVELMGEEAIGQAYDQGDPRAIAYAENQEQQQLTNDALQQAQLQQAVTAPDAPGAPFIDSRVQQLQQQAGELGVPPESQGVGVQTNPASDPNVPNLAAPDIPLGPQDVGAVPGIDTAAPEAPAPEPEPPKSMAKADPAKAQELATKVIETAGEEPPEELMAAKTKDVSMQGQEAIKKNPGIAQMAKSTISKAFGNMFDGEELVRMGVLFAGALATGASPGQALAYAGQSYLARVDAAQSTYDKVALSGKYNEASVAAYKQSGDLNDLVPVGVAPQPTGKFSTKYTKAGKPVTVQEYKVGDQTVFFDEDNRQRSGFELSGQSPKERADTVKTNAGSLKPVLSALRENFGGFKGDDGQMKYSHDVIPEVAAHKAAEFFVDEGVDPQEMGSIVEAAWHDMVNDKRQDGSRARDIVPYIRQNIVRNRVGNHAGAFKAKGGGYVDPKRLGSLNQAATRWLRSNNMKGDTKDLTDQFYNAALEDWNALDKDIKEMHNRKAGKNENGFMLWTEDWLTSQMGG